MTTDGHLDAVVLAEYDDGLLDQPAATDVREHLAQCPTCSATLNGLGDVRDSGDTRQASFTFVLER